MGRVLWAWCFSWLLLLIFAASARADDMLKISVCVLPQGIPPDIARNGWAFAGDGTVVVRMRREEFQRATKGLHVFVYRAGATYFFHLLIDEGLAADLEAAGTTGLSFRSVYAAMPDKRQVKLRWKQLCADHTLPPMSPRTTGLVRDRACEVCRRNGYFQTRKAPTRIVYRASDLRDV